MHTVDAAGDWISIQCPHCFETMEIVVDAETAGELVQDCEVCCRPWQLNVHRRSGQPVRVEVQPI